MAVVSMMEFQSRRIAVKINRFYGKDDDDILGVRELERIVLQFYVRGKGLNFVAVLRRIESYVGEPYSKKRKDGDK